MELREFVRDSLIQIAGGVREANEHALGSTNQGAYTLSASGDPTETGVMFDVAVTAGSTSSREAGGGLRVAGVGVGASGANEATEERVSRIRFCVTRRFEIR